MSSGNGKAPETLRLEAEILSLCARVALAERALAEVRGDLRAMLHICETQPMGLCSLLITTIRGALSRSLKIYPEED